MPEARSSQSLAGIDFGFPKNHYNHLQEFACPMRCTMRNCLVGLSFLCLWIGFVAGAQSQQKKERKKPPAYTNAKEAGPDFAIQGEYTGEVQHGDEAFRFGAQVIALGEGKFRIKFLKGGLPGAGWDGSTLYFADAATKDGKTTLAGRLKSKEGETKQYQGTISDG